MDAFVLALCRRDDSVSCHLDKKIDVVGVPCPFPLRLGTFLTEAHRAEKIIDDNRIEDLSDTPHHLLNPFLCFGIGIA